MTSRTMIEISSLGGRSDSLHVGMIASRHRTVHIATVGALPLSEFLCVVRCDALTSLARNRIGGSWVGDLFMNSIHFIGCISPSGSTVAWKTGITAFWSSKNLTSSCLALSNAVCCSDGNVLRDLTGLAEVRRTDWSSGCTKSMS